MTPEHHDMLMTILHAALSVALYPFHVVDQANNNIYFSIFYNSMQANFFLSSRYEYSWFAARAFGGYDTATITFLAFAGSTVGMLVNFGLGYWLYRWCKTLSTYDEDKYQRIAGVFRRYLYLLMAIPPLFVLEYMPLVPLFAMLCGICRVPLRKALPAIATARILYYAYYLML